MGVGGVKALLQPTNLGAYAASQSTVLQIKRINQTESPIFVILCDLCCQRQSFLTFNSPRVSMILLITTSKTESKMSSY